MSGEGQDQNVQITCCSTYGKQLLRNLCSTTGVRQPEVFCAVPVEYSEEGSHTLVIMKHIPGEPLREAWPKALYVWKRLYSKANC